VAAPRVRIAPSPTGYFHLGTGRTALFNWLYARQRAGTFVLRIEDTDSARNRPEHTEGILRALTWLGLGWDEGPYFQSQRGDLYRHAIDRLVQAGAVYACDCTPADIGRRAAERGRPGYDGHCRDLGKPVSPGSMLRFRVPPGESGFSDLIRGDVPADNRDLEDFGVRKSSGEPLFILANVVDDADMAITHVIRGADHVTNTHKYLLLWRALGYGPEPLFAHLPLINNERGQKLSKRRDKVAVEDYRDEGYLSEALVNYLALLGWSPGDDREMLSREELVAEFRLEDVKSAPARWDEKKLQSVNAAYLRALPPAELVERAQAWIRSRWEPLAPEVRERARTLAQVFGLTEFLVRPEPVLDAAAWAKEARRPAFAPALEGALAALGGLEDWDAAGIEAEVARLAERLEVKVRDVQPAIRLAVMGSPVGLPLYQSLAHLGRDRTLARLQAGLERLQGAGASG
jgi:glutamyl-tRNA synthetase